MPILLCHLEKQRVKVKIKATQMTPPLKNTRIERKYGIGTPSLVICGQKFCIDIRATPTNNLSTKPIPPYTNPDVSEDIICSDMKNL